MIKGLHHITAIASDAKRNYDFYSRVMGQRFVKKTVNFDDPGTYHFYFGDEQGTPGTVLTFFPWPRITRGRIGSGMVSEFAYAVPHGSIPFWSARLQKEDARIIHSGKRFDDEMLTFEDPDGLHVTLLSPAIADQRAPWLTRDISADHATRGFHSITLTLASTEGTREVLTKILGFHPAGEEDGRARFQTDAIPDASVVDLLTVPQSPGVNAAGTIHHVAFRVSDEITLLKYREKVLASGLSITPKIDRNYFFSLYFREPGGVLFEIATDNPGFMIDEPKDKLGMSLKLPAQYEPRRAEIEKILPVLN